MPAKSSPETSDYRAWLLHAHHAATQDYDRAILTLSSGTLALSITFAHDLAPTPAPGSTILLFIAWVLLLGATCAILFSFLTSQRSLLKTIADLDAEDWEALKQPGGRLAIWTERLNGGSAVLFVFGVVALGLFVLANLE